MGVVTGQGLIGLDPPALRRPRRRGRARRARRRQPRHAPAPSSPGSPAGFELFGVSRYVAVPARRGGGVGAGPARQLPPRRAHPDGAGRRVRRLRRRRHPRRPGLGRRPCTGLVVPTMPLDPRRRAHRHRHRRNHTGAVGAELHPVLCGGQEAHRRPTCATSGSTSSPARCSPASSASSWWWPAPRPCTSRASRSTTPPTPRGALSRSRATSPARCSRSGSSGRPCSPRPSSRCRRPTRSASSAVPRQPSTTGSPTPSRSTSPTSWSSGCRR